MTSGGVRVQSDLVYPSPNKCNPRYPTQNARNGFLPMQFTPFIWKPRCPTPTRKFRNGYVKSTEENVTPDYANCNLVVN